MANQPTTPRRKTIDSALAQNLAENVEELHTANDPTMTHETIWGYFRLRAALQMSMGDMSPWHPDGPDGRPRNTYPVDITGRETDELVAYIEHMTEADHGPCERCGRAVAAAQPFVELDERWTLRRVWHATVDAFRGFWYLGRTRRIAHTRCAWRTR